MSDTRTFEHCHLVNAAVIAKDGKNRQTQGGWTYARCLHCPLALWIPKGGGYTLPDVCKRPSQNPPPGTPP